jgi:hypothetical protein
MRSFWVGSRFRGRFPGFVRIRQVQGFRHGPRARERSVGFVGFVWFKVSRFDSLQSACGVLLGSSVGVEVLYRLRR